MHADDLPQAARGTASGFDNPRESMAILPAVAQPFLTWLTGMPLRGEIALFRWTPWSLVLCTLGEIMVGLLIGVAALGFMNWSSLLLVPISWLLTTGGLRMFFVVIEHSCTHHIFSPTRWVNETVADIISAAFWTQDYGAFKREHATHHRVTRLANDPDTLFLARWGFVQGMPGQAVARRLAVILVSPAYHLMTFAERLRYSVGGRAYKRLLAPAIFTLTFVAVAYYGLWLDWIVLWLVPTTILFQASMLINILTEHRWPARGATKRELAVVCFGRFCGERTPHLDDCSDLMRMALWARWWARVVLVFLPYRLFVLVGDEPQHDLHHRQPLSDWANAKFARQAQTAIGQSDIYGEYRDEWGTLLDHLNAASCTLQVTGRNTD